MTAITWTLYSPGCTQTKAQRVSGGKLHIVFFCAMVPRWFNMHRHIEVGNKLYQSLDTFLSGLPRHCGSSMIFFHFCVCLRGTRHIVRDQLQNRGYDEAGYDDAEHSQLNSTLISWWNMFLKFEISELFGGLRWCSSIIEVLFLSNFCFGERKNECEDTIPLKRQHCPFQCPTEKKVGRFKNILTFVPYMHFEVTQSGTSRRSCWIHCIWLCYEWKSVTMQTLIQKWCTYSEL